MKKALLFFTILFLLAIASHAQYYASFVVKGDYNKFYPVVINDVDWFNNRATVIDIGRSNVHLDSDWHGALIARFRLHSWNWGNGASFIDADIRQFTGIANTTMIAGWRDATEANGYSIMIIWLRGSTTYFISAPQNPNVLVYDGVQNNLPYQEPNGPAHSYKTNVESYVNSFGLNYGGTAYFTGISNNNYFAGNVGIGTTNPDQKLSVAGTIHSQAVKVDMTGWSDYVFKPAYSLSSLKNIKSYIDKNHHLPDMPSEKDVVKNGVDLGEMLKLQQKKIEELTLYLIDQQKQISQLKKQIRNSHK